MDKHYYAVTRVGSEDELQHWKYIKKIKVKGKWRYFYDQEELDKFKYGDKEVSVKRDTDSYTSYGDLIKTTKTYKKSNSLFSKKTVNKEYETQPKRSMTKTWKITNEKVTYKQGKLSRLQAKAEKWVFDTFLKPKNKKKKKSSGNKLIEKGKKFVGDFLSKTVKEAEKPKYIAKVKMPNGRTRYFYSQDEYEAYNKRLKYQKDEPNFLKHLKKLDKDTIESADEAMEAVNPKYKTGRRDYTENCFKCVMTYELRRRGYDVEAAKANPEEQKISDISTMFKNAKTYKVTDDGKVVDVNKKLSTWEKAKRLFVKEKRSDPDGSTISKAMLKHSPKNSRGIVTVNWNRGGAHALAYEVTSKNKVIVRDPQTNDVYDIDSISSRGYDITFTRLDNLEAKKKVLKNVK